MACQATFPHEKASPLTHASTLCCCMAGVCCTLYGRCVAGNRLLSDPRVEQAMRATDRRCHLLATDNRHHVPCMQHPTQACPRFSVCMRGACMTYSLQRQLQHAACNIRRAATTRPCNTLSRPHEVLQPVPYDHSYPTSDIQTLITIVHTRPQEVLPAELQPVRGRAAANRLVPRQRPTRHAQTDNTQWPLRCALRPSLLWRVARHNVTTPHHHLF